MESNDAARAMFDTMLENCIFYISPMYEFLHSQGQTRTFGAVGSMSALPPESGHQTKRFACPLCADFVAKVAEERSRLPLAPS
jgi:hypothetical protein